MTTFNITGSISTNDPISASYVAAANIDGIVASSSVAVSASYAPSLSGGINGMTYITASTTWTVPSGISKIRVVAIGAGGGAAGGNFNWPQGHGAGGGGYSEGIVDVSGYSTIPITVGVKGTSGTSGNENDGTSGGLTGLFQITASGGGAATKTGNGGGGGATGGSINNDGQSGTNINGGMSGNLPWIPKILPTNHDDVPKGHGAFGFNSSAGDGVMVIYY